MGGFYPVESAYYSIFFQYANHIISAIKDQYNLWVCVRTYAHDTIITSQSVTYIKLCNTKAFSMVLNVKDGNRMQIINCKLYVCSFKWAAVWYSVKHKQHSSLMQLDAEDGQNKVG